MKRSEEEPQYEPTESVDELKRHSGARDRERRKTRARARAHFTHRHARTSTHDASTGDPRFYGLARAQFSPFSSRGVSYLSREASRVLKIDGSDLFLRAQAFHAPTSVDSRREDKDARR